MKTLFGKNIMRAKIIIVVIIMVSLCSCISLSEELSAQKVLRIFASMYAPNQHNHASVMTFGNEHLTTEGIVDDTLTGQKIYK